MPEGLHAASANSRHPYFLASFGLDQLDPDKFLRESPLIMVISSYWSHLGFYETFVSC